MRHLLTILAVIAMASTAVFIGGSAPALAIMLRPALIENLAIPALMAVPSIVVMAFSMGVLLFRVQPTASPIALCIGIGLVSLMPVVSNLSASVPYSVTPMSSATHFLAGLFVALPSVVVRCREFAGRTRTAFIAATALVFGVTLWFSVHHSIRPVTMAIEPLRPSPNLPRFNGVGTSLADFPRQQNVRGESEQQTNNPASPTPPNSPHAAVPKVLLVPPGLEREQKFQAAFRQALDAGTLPRNSELERMRDAVVNGAAAAKAAPCDAAVRGALHDAIVTFIRDMPRIANRDKIEIFSAEGISRETSIVFNQPALKIKRAALHDRLVAIDDLPAMARPSFADPQPADTDELAMTLQCPGLSAQH
jgi:hypothetical protein